MSPRGYTNKKLDPHFEVQMRDEKGGKHVLEPETEVSGTLVSIGHGEYEYEGRTIPTIHIVIFDDNAFFKVDTSINSNTARGLMNTICGTKTFDYIRLSMYAKNDFPQLYVSDQPGQGTDRVKWRFDSATELKPLVQEVPDHQDPKKMVKVYHKVNQLLLDEWKKTELIVKDYAASKGYNKLGTAPSSSSNAAIPETQSHLDPETKNEVDNFQMPTSESPFNNQDANAADDLPF
jgi:hypothetical protein